MNKKVALVLMVLSIGLIAVGVFMNKSKVYTVSFDSDGGTSIESQSIKENDKVSQPDDPTKMDCVFIGWIYKGETYDFSQEVKSDMTLKAEWKEVDGDEKIFVVKFDSDGGSTVLNQTVIEGKQILKPADPVKEGYKFVEWTYNDKSFDFDTVLTKDVSLKAKWEKEEVKVESSPSPSPSTTPSPKPVASSTPKPVSEPKPVTINYVVGFESNGGTSYASKTVVSGSKISSPGNPTRDSYSFLGWYSDNNGNNLYDFSKPVTSNIILYAKWQRIDSYRISLVKDDTNGVYNITVYKNDAPVSFSKINHADGSFLSDSSTVNIDSISSSERSFQVVFSDGSTKVINAF